MKLRTLLGTYLFTKNPVSKRCPWPRVPGDHDVCPSSTVPELVPFGPRSCYLFIHGISCALTVAVYSSRVPGNLIYWAAKVLDVGY